MSRKTVRFTDKIDSRVIQHHTPERVMDVEIATDTIVKFLNTKVGDVIVTAGKHYSSHTRRSPQSPVNYDKMTRNYNKALQYVFNTNAPRRELATPVTEYIQKNSEKRIKTVIHEAIMNPNQNDVFYTSLVLIKMGLKSFIDFKHCLNSCPEILSYATNPNEFTVRVTKLGQNNKTLLNACINAHNVIEDTIGIDDIRKFDELLRVASRGRCYLAIPPSRAAPVAAGSSHMIHQGPMGGRYILVDGKKKYIA